MKKIIIIVLSICFILSADFVPLDRAKKVAENYYKNYAPAAQKSNVITRTIAKKYLDEVTYYAFEFGDKNGFVIVTADDGLRTILGWSFDSGLCSEEDFYNMKNPFANRMSWTDREIIQARKDKFVDVQARKDWKDMESNMFPSSSKAIVVPALVQSRWGQDYPYNLACPTDSGVATENGCVALAMAQIMRYHQAPSNPMGSHSYLWYGAISSDTLSVDFTTVNYNYSIMPLTTAGYTTAAQRNEVSELCYHAGVSVNMDYGTEADSGSGAYTSDVVAAMESHFEYFSDAFYVSIGTVTNEQAQSANINTDLSNARPIIWSGSGADGGHCFILDGRTDDYQYHFNWGWEGSMDGWFKLNNLNPGSDFTSSQGAIYNLWVSIPGPIFRPPTNVQTAIANLEDVTVTWTRPAGTKSDGLAGYKIFRNDSVIDSLSADVFTYNDFDLAPGIYVYYLTAIYRNEQLNYECESYKSVSSTATITENSDYPVALNLKAAAVGRTAIDLSWHKPYIGFIYFNDGFEDGNISDWTQKSHNVWGIAKAWTAETTTWKCADASGWPDATAAGIHDGTYSMGCMWNTALNAWSVYSPSFTATAGATISYYVWYENDTYPTVVYSGLYGGTWAETKWTAILANMEVVDTLDAASEVDHMTKAHTFVTTKTGSVRLFFWYNYNDGWEFTVDDIVIGNGSKYEYSKGSVEPTEYQIYRNGSLAATVPRTGLEESWTDTGFADGTNDYFVRCLYPAGISIPSNRAAAFMNANPVPEYLTGVYNAALSNVDLDWYAPLHLPPGWFGYADDEPYDFFDYLDLTSYPGTFKKKRTLFSAEALGLYYPITLDSVSAAFYEDSESDPWVDSLFTFKIYSKNENGTQDSILYGPSGYLKAESGKFTCLKLPAPLIMIKDWWIEVEVRTDNAKSQPGLLTSYVESNSHSETYYSGDSNHAAGWYTIYASSGSYENEWWILGYCTGSEPIIYKNSTCKKQAHNVVGGLEKEIIASTKAKTLNNINISSKTSNPNKGLLGYNIYRDAEKVGTAVESFWSDSLKDIKTIDANYFVTAYYEDPPGESAPSNVITVTITGIEDNIPYKTALSQNYPNPFNPETNIRFSIAADTNVKLKIFNTAGQLVALPLNKFMNKGSYNIVLNALKLSGGIYIYKLEADGKEFTKKMTIIK